MSRSFIGGRCLIALVDKNISKDVVKDIIAPMTLSGDMCFYY